MATDVRSFYITPRVWAAAWALHVTLAPDGFLHVNIDEFAKSVHVPTDPAALEALAAIVHKCAELTYGQAMPVEVIHGRYDPPATRH